MAENKALVYYKAALFNAKMGNIRSHVPPEMTVTEPETVSVRIYGHDVSEQLRREFKATEADSRKVTTNMLVTLGEPDNPGSFKIVEDPKESGIKFVPPDSYAEWSWTVTPLKPAKDERHLRVMAYLELDQEISQTGHTMDVQIMSYPAPVTVKVQPKWDRFKDWMSENWKDVLKYLIPTGAGSVFIVWLIAKLAGKSSKPEEKEKEKEKEPEEEDDDPV